MTSETSDDSTGPTIACDWGKRRQLPASRNEMHDELFRHIELVRELDDGSAYQWSSAATWAAVVFDFVDAERQCCPFFTFEVVIEPNDGAVWLRLRGSAEIKAFVRDQVNATL